MNLAIPILWAYCNHAPKDSKKKGCDYYFCSNKFIHDEITDGFDTKLSWWQDFSDLFRIVIVGSTVIFSSEDTSENLFYFQIILMSIFLFASAYEAPFEGGRHAAINQLNIVVLSTELIAVLATHYEEPILQWILVCIFLVAFVAVQAASFGLTCCFCNSSKDDTKKNLQQHGTAYWVDEIDDTETALFRTSRLHDCLCWNPMKKQSSLKEDSSFSDTFFDVIEKENTMIDVTLTKKFIILVETATLPSSTKEELQTYSYEVKGKEYPDVPKWMELSTDETKHDFKPVEDTVVVTQKEYKKMKTQKEYKLKVKFQYTDDDADERVVSTTISIPILVKDVLPETKYFVWTVPKILPAGTMDSKTKKPIDTTDLDKWNQSDKKLLSHETKHILKEEKEQVIAYTYVGSRINKCSLVRNRTIICCQRTVNRSRWFFNRCLFCPTQISMHPIKLRS